MVIGNDCGMVHSRASPVPELTNVLTACNVDILLWARPPQITISILLEKTQKSSSRLASSLFQELSQFFLLGLQGGIASP